MTCSGFTLCSLFVECLLYYVKLCGAFSNIMDLRLYFYSWMCSEDHKDHQNHAQEALILWKILDDWTMFYKNAKLPWPLNDVCSADRMTRLGSSHRIIMDRYEG